MLVAAFAQSNVALALATIPLAGSLLIGFLLGCCGVVAPMMALFVPLLDVVLSVARRFPRHQPIFTADRGHIHHRFFARRPGWACNTWGTLSSTSPATCWSGGRSAG